MFCCDPLCQLPLTMSQSDSGNADSKSDSKDGKDAKADAPSPATAATQTSQQATSSKSSFHGLLDPRLLTSLVRLPSSFVEIIIALKSDRSKFLSSYGRDNFPFLLDCLEVVREARGVTVHQPDCACLIDELEPELTAQDVRRDFQTQGYYELSVDRNGRFVCGALNPIMYALCGGVFFPAHMTLKDVSAVTPFENRTLSYLAAIARRCLDLNLQPDTSMLRVPSQSVAQLVVRRSLDITTLETLKTAHETLAGALGRIPLVKAVELLLNDLMQTSQRLGDKTTTLSEQLLQLREAEMVCAESDQLDKLFPQQAPIDLSVADELPAEVKRIQTGLLKAQRLQMNSSSAFSSASSASSSTPSNALSLSSSSSIGRGFDNLTALARSALQSSHSTSAPSTRAPPSSTAAAEMSAPPMSPELSQALAGAASVIAKAKPSKAPKKAQSGHAAKKQKAASAADTQAVAERPRSLRQPTLTSKALEAVAEAAEKQPSRSSSHATPMQDVE